MFSRTFTYSIILFVFSSSGSAQPTRGFPPYGTFGGGSVDGIDLANLNVHLSIPIIGKAGRGLPFSYNLGYDNSIWAQATVSGTLTWVPVSNGWGASTQVETGYVTYRTTQPQCGPNPSYYFYQYDNFNYYDSQGTPHAVTAANGSSVTLAYVVNCEPGSYPPSSATGTTRDGSGYTVSLTAGYNVAYAGSAINVSGTTIMPSPPGSGSGGMTDRNGNQITFATNGGTLTFTDTLGKPALTIPNSGLLTYKNPQGGDTSFTPTYEVKNVRTNFGCPGVAEFVGSFSVLTGLSLPDGSSYSFAYEQTPNYSTYVTGRIASVTLPTGGSISYAYSNGNNGIYCNDATTPFLTRTITTPDGTSVWTYDRSSGNTTVTDPDTPTHNQTVLKFQGIYEVQRKVYQGSATGALLKTVDTCYNGSASPCTGTAVSPPITQIAATTTLGTSTMKARTVVWYNNTTYNGLPLELDEYDYYTTASPPSNPTRKTVTVYTVLTNGPQDRPYTVTLYDSNGSQFAQTTYLYDQATPVPTSNTPQHISVTTPRGNLAQVTGLPGLVRSFTYFDTGNVQTAKDVNYSQKSTQATYTYGACGNSFLTGTSTAGSDLQATLTTSATWDDPNCYGAVQLSTTDANGQVAHVDYADNTIWRPTSVVDPTLATTNFSYSSGPYSDSSHPWTESALDFNGTTSTIGSRTTLDGLGRQHVTQRRQAQGSAGSGNYDSVETDYDPVGRPSRVTVPYPTTAGGTNSTATSTKTTYDALGRPTLVKLVDSSGTTIGFTSYTYAQNDVLIAEGVGTTTTRQRQLEYDGLGRLTSVCEMSAAGGTCGQTGSQTGYWTKYTYNPLDNLKSVTQNAQTTPTQTRNYTYDAMGRMLTETNPETAGASYTYVYDTATSPCTQSSNGDLVKRTDPVGNITCYSYDALHRVKSITHPSGSYATRTPDRTFVYDSATVNGQTMAYAKGRLARAYTGASQTTDLGFSYTARGEVADAWQKSGNPAYWYHITTGYWPTGPAGLVKTLSLNLSGYPTWTYTPEGEGRIVSVTDSRYPNSPIAAMPTPAYNIFGLPNGVTLGSGDTDAFGYDPNTGRVTSFQGSLPKLPTVTLEVSGAQSGSTFKDTDSFTLTVHGAANKPVWLTYGSTRVQYPNTDASGSLVVRGQWTSAYDGAWSQTWSVGDAGADVPCAPHPLNFNLIPTDPTPAGPNPSILGNLLTGNLTWRGDGSLTQLALIDGFNSASAQNSATPRCVTTRTTISAGSPRWIAARVNGARISLTTSTATPVGRSLPATWARRSRPLTIPTTASARTATTPTATSPAMARTLTPGTRKAS